MKIKNMKIYNTIQNSCTTRNVCHIDMAERA